MIKPGEPRLCFQYETQSGNDVRNDLIFHFLKLVLDCEFFLLHALDAQLVAADSYHRIDGCIEIRVFLFQTCDGQPDLGLFLIGHAEPHSVE